MKAYLLAGMLAAAWAGAAGATAFTDFQKLKSEGKLAEALKVLREEFASPSLVHSVGSQPVFLRQHFLLTLGEYAKVSGPTPELDAEAKRIYDEGLERHAGGDGERQAYLHNGMALYYSNSLRNGFALPFMRRELAYWEGRKDTFRLMLGYDAIAKAYWDMGEAEMSLHYEQRTLEQANGHFVLGERPRDINQWAQYDTVLNGMMDRAAQLRDVAALERLWPLRDPIGRTYWKIDALTKIVAAQQFAIGGAPERARALLAQAREQWPKEREIFNNDRIRKGGDIGLLCADAELAHAAGDFATAVRGWERCIEGTRSMGVDENAAVFEQKRGFALERTGAAERAVSSYRAAIAAAETTRASFSIAERARFFRTLMRQPYWGLVRLLAQRAASGDEAAFFEAMYTSELVRGRQLGELVDAETSARISPQSLAALRARLPADTAVLAFTATDGEIVLLAMDRERTIAAVTAYDGKRFAGALREIAAELARPTSAAAGIEAKLLAASRQLLAPAWPLLAGKKRIVALPDGIMNVIPFELFSASADAYRPLIADFVVAASPSLVFIQHAESRRRSGAADLMAIADPRFGKPDSVAGASADELKAATRGSRYLSYFEPLPETRSEADAIAKLFAGQNVALLTGGEALESRLKLLDLTRFGFLHLATHGILGGEVPGIGEPALVLGLEPAEDGFLTSSEVARLRLDAELTVLSACNTGSGEFVTGEGVMGMSRAFLAAGSRSVVVSLWPVASRQTERLMVDFYRHLRAGRDAAEALRAAKLEMIEAARKSGTPESHPFFWAPFILLGG